MNQKGSQLAKKILASQLSGLDVGKIATVSPSPGFAITDEIRAVIHGRAVGGAIDEGAPSPVWVRFRNVLPVRAFEMGDRGDGFTFDSNETVEVQD